MGEESIAVEKESQGQILEQRVLKNFYLSYKFSQGLPDLQRNLLIAVTRLYGHDEFIEEFPSIKALDKKIRPKIEKLQVPKAHARQVEGGSITPELMKEDFVQQWSNQLRILERFLKGGSHTDSYIYDSYDKDTTIDTVMAKSQEDLILLIVGDMATRDIGYLKRGERLQRSYGSQEAVNSFVKDYVLDQKPTGSKEFDQLFRNIRITIPTLLDSDYEIVDESNLTRKLAVQYLRQLKELWELKHPEEKFMAKTETEPVTA